MRSVHFPATGRGVVKKNEGGAGATAFGLLHGKYITGVRYTPFA